MPPGGPVAGPRDVLGAAWTGSDALFVRYGLAAQFEAAFFDPCAGRWEAVVSLGAPEQVARAGLVGGQLHAFTLAAEPRGFRYDRARRRWDPSPLPHDAFRAPALDGRVVLFAGDDAYDDGAIVEGASGARVAIAAAHAPSPRVMAAEVVVPSGRRLFVFGGRSRRPAPALGDGATLDLDLGSWRPLPSEHAPSPRFAAAALAHEGDVVVWGGRDDEPRRDGARYSLAERRWTPMESHGAPRWDERGVAAFTGRFLVVAAGRQGARYDFAEARWSSLALPVAVAAPTARAHVMPDASVLLVAGDGAFVWRLDPATGTFVDLSIEGGPRPGRAVLVGGPWVLSWGGRLSLQTAPTPTEGGLSVPGSAREEPARDGSLLFLGALR